jgi:23S rRNA (adenine2503-C2)-methyltransferase
MLRLTKKLMSADGSVKYLLKTDQGHYIESVFFRLDNKTTAHYSFTLCLSSQAGCALKCSFCETGRLGLYENLTCEQISAQLNVILTDLLQERLILDQENYHIALMGMGEPLHNYDEICRFYKDVTREQSQLAKISLSTVGLAPRIIDLSEDDGVHYDLFLSLHTPFDDERNKIIPVNKKYPINTLIEACILYSQRKNELVKISYLLIKGVNDSEKHAFALAELLSSKYFAVQLLLYNPIGENLYSRPEYEVAEAFQNKIRANGLDCHIVVSKGIDIMAGCGQLSGKQGGSNEA